MKRKFCVIFACVMCLSALAACGTEPAEESSAIIGGAESETSIVVSDVQADYATVEELLENEDVKATLAETITTMVGENLCEGMELTGEGNTLVCTLVYQNADEDTDLDSLSTALKSTVDFVGESFQAAANALTGFVSDPNPTLELVYETDTGTELLRQTYTAE